MVGDNLSDILNMSAIRIVLIAIAWLVYASLHTRKIMIEFPIYRINGSIQANRSI